jgi:hypothetical protein
MRCFTILAALAVLSLSVVSTATQQPRKTTASSNPRINRQPVPPKTSYSKPSPAIRAYTPRIKSRSSSFVIEGLITSLKDNVITIKTARGARYDFSVDDQTSVFGSGELFSISTIQDIALSVADLHISDYVELVTERTGRKEVARIVTRIASSGAQVAKR